MLKCKLCGNNTDNTSGICFECSGSQHICQCDEVDLARSMKPEEDWEARIKAFIQTLLIKERNKNAK